MSKFWVKSNFLVDLVLQCGHFSRSLFIQVFFLDNCKIFIS